MSDVARLTERLIVMNESRLVMDDVPANVFDRAEELLTMGLDIPEITRVFLRLKQMGADVPSVYTIDQAVDALKKLSGGMYHA
jgi:energy-coupling factor transport system ATP-binding protein